MKLKNSRLVKYLFSLLVLTCIVFIIALCYYYYNTRIYSRIEIKSNSRVSVFFVSPVGKKQFIGTTSLSPLVIEKRPIKQIELVDKGETTVINNFTDIFFYNINDKKVSIKYDNHPASIHEIFKWLFNNEFFLFITFLIFSFTLIIIIVKQIFNTYIIQQTLRIKKIIIRIKNNIKRKKNHTFRWLLRGNRIEINPANEFPKVVFYQKILITILLMLTCAYLYIGLGNNQLSRHNKQFRRAIVTMEMKISGNYIAPTICGEPYCRKFPLGHWAFLPFIDNSQNMEWYLRAIPVSFIILSCLIIFYFTKKHLNSYFISILSAVSFLCSFFVLNTKDSVQIDQFFTFICLLLFFINYSLWKANKIYGLFIYSYLITFLGFLTKGFVMIYFNWISLFILLYLHNQIRLFFSWKHFLGLALFMVLAAGYFFTYSLYFDPGHYLFTQFLEIDQFSEPYTLMFRLNKFLGYWGTLMILYSPILVYLPLLFIKKQLIDLIKNKFKAYLFLISAFCMVVFWTSPMYSPYYVLMFSPLLMILLIDLIFRVNLSSAKHKIVLLLIIFIIIFFSVNNLFQTELWVRQLIPVFCLITLLSILPVLSPLKFRLNVLLFTWFGFLLISYLIDSANLKVLEGADFKTSSKYQAEKIIKRINKQPLMIFSNETFIEEKAIFYLEYYSKTILRIANSQTPNDNVYFLANKNQIEADFNILDSIPQYDKNKANKINGSYFQNYCPVYLIKKDAK